MPAGPAPPRAPSTTSCRVGSGAQSGDAAAMRRAVIIAVPEGASALASWCSSMTSAVSKNGAASSAKRIISTAPMAKFAAIRQLDRVNADRSAAMSSSVKPVVPTTACSPCSAHQATLARAASRTVRSTATSTSAASMAARSSATAIPAIVPPARLRATAATSSSSGSAAMAAHAVVPIRPVAPNTPTRSGALAVIAAPYSVVAGAGRRPRPPASVASCATGRLDRGAGTGLGAAVDVRVVHDGDDRVATRGRVVGQEDEGLAVGRDLHCAEHDALARELVRHGSLQRRAGEAQRHPVRHRRHRVVGAQEGLERRRA